MQASISSVFDPTVIHANFGPSLGKVKFITVFVIRREFCIFPDKKLAAAKAFRVAKYHYRCRGVSSDIVGPALAAVLNTVIYRNNS